MKRVLLTVVLAALAFAGGVAVMFTLGFGPKFRPPDPPSVVVKMKEIARLETLEVNLYKKVTFAPEPVARESLMGDVFEWAKFTLMPREGRAIIFATVRLGLDLDRLDASALQVSGDSIHITLPPLKPVVELRPAETEVIGSNLDSAGTAQLMDVAKRGFEREVMADRRLMERAEGSAQRALKGLLLELGFRRVTFGPPVGTNAG